MPNEQYGNKYNSSYIFVKDRITCKLPKIIPDINTYDHLFLKTSKKAFLNINSSVNGASIDVIIIDITGKLVNKFLTFCSLVAIVPDKRYEIIRLNTIIRNRPINQ